MQTPTSSEIVGAHTINVEIVPSECVTAFVGVHIVLWKMKLYAAFMISVQNEQIYSFYSENHF